MASLRSGWLATSWPLPVSLAAAAAILLAGFFFTRRAFRDNPVGHFLCQFAIFAGATLVIVGGGVVPFEPAPAMPPVAGMRHLLEAMVVGAFKMVWWLAGAWLLAGLTRAALAFRRKPVETRFLQDLCAGFIYVSAVLGITSYVFGISLGGLLAASGIVAIVLGLALQSTLGDVFSGVVLNLGRPYHPGDWVTLESGLTGRVMETNWRATQLLTLSHDVAIIPNSVIARTRLVNLSKPGGAHGVTLSMRVDPAGAPAAAVAILETAMLGCSHILRDPKPVVTILSLDALALECELMCFVAAYEQGPAARNEVFDRVFRHCMAAGLRPAPPAGSPGLPVPHAASTHDETARRLLDHLPVFASLTGEERAALVPGMRRDTFKAGETLLEEDSVAPALFILTAGVLVASRLQNGTDVETTRLAPGECFGQSSARLEVRTFFKVRALTRATVYRIARAELTPLLLARPAFLLDLEQLAARRIGAASPRASPAVPSPPATAGSRLAGRLRTIYRLLSSRSK